LSKEKTIEFITNIIDSVSETSICSGNLEEFITNVVIDDSETSICSGNFVFMNAILYKNISTLINTHDILKYHEWIKIILESGLIQSFDFFELNDVNEIGKGTLRNLHDNNVIHGDLHPKNILIVSDDKNKFNKAAITDFRSASKSDDSMPLIYGKSFTVAIADFGSALKSDDSLVFIFGKSFTIEYTDPQLFFNTPIIGPTFKSDIL
ncbi:2742_t:CDS:2, partial [Gigaspora rosea]